MPSSAIQTPTTRVFPRIHGAQVLLAIILVLAAALRLYHLGYTSLWLDEVGQALVAQGHLTGILAGVQGHHGAAPFDYLITALVIRLSRNEWVLRLPAAIWGTLSVFWLYRLGRRSGSVVVGLVASALLAVSPLHLRYSQELRFYALFVFLSLISTEVLWMAWARGRSRLWVLYAALLILGLYTHYYTAFIIVFHVLWVISVWAKKCRQVGIRSANTAQPIAFALCAAFAVIAFIPWLWYAVLRERGSALFGAPPLTFDLAKDVLIAFSGRSTAWWGLWGGLAIGGLLVCARRDGPMALLLGAWAALPLPAVVLTDRQLHYLFDVRQVLFVLPVYLLLVAAGIEGIGQLGLWMAKHLWLGEKQRLQVTICIVATVALLLTATPQIRGYYEESRDDWRAVGQMLESNWRPGEKIALFNVQSYMGYYAPDIARSANSVLSLADLQRIHATGQPLWAVLTPYLGQLADAQAIQAWLEERAHLDFDFGLGMHVFYLQADRGEPELWQRLRAAELPAQAGVWLAKAQAARAVKEWGDAQSAFTLAASYASDLQQQASYLFAAGEMAHLRGLYGDAIAYYDRALRLAPSLDRARTNKAAALLAIGMPQRALDELAGVLGRLSRNEYWPNRVAGDVLLAANRPAEAIVYLQQALDLSPDTHDLRYYLGLCNEQLGRREEARHWWQDYLNRQPDGPLVVSVRAGLARLSGN